MGVRVGQLGVRMTRVVPMTTVFEAYQNNQTSENFGTHRFWNMLLYIHDVVADFGGLCCAVHKQHEWTNQPDR